MGTGLPAGPPAPREATESPAAGPHQQAEPASDDDPGRIRSAAIIALLGIAIGVLVGFAEGVSLWIRRSAGAVTFSSRHVLWMTALSYAVIFLPAAAALAAGALAAPRIVTRRLAAAAYIAAAVFFLLLPFGWLSRYAVILLGLGVASRVWSGWDRHSGRIERVAVHGSAAVMTLLLLTASATPIAGMLDGDRAAPPPDATNVVLLIWDTARATSLGLYGHDRPTTPELQRIASGGTVFDNAISTSPWTLPSHSSMFTGRLPHEVSADWFVALDDEHPVLAEWLRDRGWRTGGFVANHHYTSDDSGLGRGFDEYEDYFVSFRQVLLTSNLMQTGTGSGVLNGLRERSLSRVVDAFRRFHFYPREKRSSDRKHAEVVNDEFLEWLDARGDRPFFAFLNYFDAHQGYWAPDSLRERFQDGRPDDDYDAALAYLDQQTGRLFDALASRGLLDRTLFIVTSDHGELFGEHGQHGHASNLYGDVLHVPLLMHLPGVVPPGRRVPDVVSLADMAATVAAVTGGESPPFPGHPLTRYFGDRPDTAGGWALAEVRPGRSHPGHVPLSRGAMTALIAGGYHYILNGDGREELFPWTGGGEPADLTLRSDEATGAALREARLRIRGLLAEPAHHRGWAVRDSLIGLR